MKIKKNICLFISQANSSFVINEIICLSELFESVTVINLRSDATEIQFPSNVKMISLDYKGYNTLKTFSRHFFIFFSLHVTELYKNPRSILCFNLFKINLSRLLRDLYISDRILEISILHKNTIFYSFWFDNWATSLAILKKSKKINDFFTLAHGYDLYEYRTPVTKKIAYRWFQLKYVSKVFSVSKMGENYLKEKYPKYSQKISTVYLQTSYSGSNPFNSKEFILVTCANFSSVKRIDLIPKILERVTFPVKWIYIGYLDYRDDKVSRFLNEVDQLKNANPLITIEIRGSLTNEEVLAFYKEQTVSALLSVSESEGLPYSMIEAISFGIPIISTNVGGCSEIVNDNTGILIDANFTYQEAADSIASFLNSEKHTAAFRKGVVTFWENNFSENKNKFLKKFGISSPTVKVSCKKCVLDSECVNDITLDEKGICNYCNYHDTQMLRLGSDEEKHEWLNLKLAEIVKKGKVYNCLLGVSGGVDSTYLAYWCKQNNLKPLVVHFDNGWNSELAVRNIENICTILEFELETLVINWNEFKELQLSYLRAGVIDIEVLTDHAIYATLVKIAKKNNIKYILSGFNLATESIMPKEWVFDKGDWANIKDIYSQYGSKYALKTFPHISFFDKLYNYIFHQIETVQVLNYIEYNKESAKEIIKKELKWIDYGGKHYESIFTKFYQSYILPTKFNVDKRKAHLSSLICSNQITKNQALEVLGLPLFETKDIETEKDYVLKKLGLTEQEFNSMMSEKPRSHSDFKTEKALWENYFKIIRIFKFWKYK